MHELLGFRAVDIRISCQNRKMLSDDVLNMCSTPPQDIVGLETSSLEKTSNGWDSEKEHTSESNTSLLSDVQTTSKRSSSELMEEIAKIEVEIVHLERHLLSLYRTTFNQHIGYNAEQMNGGSPVFSSSEPSQDTESGMSNDCINRPDQSSPTSSLAGPRDSVEVATPNSSSRKEKQSVHRRACSLADHIGNIDNALVRPDRLSEDIIRCISSIYCKLANAKPTDKGGTAAAASSASSFSSSTLSPTKLSGSWSPLCNREDTENCDLESLKDENSEPCSAMVEVLKISIDDERYSYATAMVEKLRSLVKSLEIVDPMKLRREEKLVFWINIHNALLMHAYFAYGTQNYVKSTGILKAAYNVGGHCVNAFDIQSSILGIRSHYSATWLQSIMSAGKKFRTGNTKHPYAIEYPEPLVHFALRSGSYSEPMVRVFKAESVFNDLQVAKEDYIQATVYVHKESKIYLPRILGYYAKDMSLGMAALLEVVSECMPPIQRKAIVTCAANSRLQKFIRWLDQSPTFRYLILKETVANR